MKRRVLNFMYKPEYREIIRSVQEGTKSIKTLVGYDSSDERIRGTKDSIVTDIGGKITAFVKNEKNRITTELNSIEKSYSNSRGVYKNPTEELLRRQDFDMELSTMSEDDIKKMIYESKRELNNYELNKLYSLEYKDSNIKARLKSSIDQVKNPHRSDKYYQELQKELADIELLNSTGLGHHQLMYIPTNTPQGYTTARLKSFFDTREMHTLNGNINMLEQALNVEPVKTIGITDENTKRELQKFKAEEQKALKKEMKYEDLDPRIFKGGKKYDVGDRFRYLKERFDDTETDRFSPLNPNYNVLDHITYLEARHSEMLSSDDKYRAAYEAAEIDAKAMKENEEEATEENSGAVE